MHAPGHVGADARGARDGRDAHLSDKCRARHRVGHPVPTCDRRERRADARAATETRCSPAAKVRRSRIREALRSVARECASGRVEPRQPRARVSRDEQRLRWRRQPYPKCDPALAREGQQAKSIQSPFFEKKKTALKEKNGLNAHTKNRRSAARFLRGVKSVRRAPRARVSRVYVHLALKKLPRVRLERARLRVRARIGAGSKRERFAWLRARTTFQSGECTLGKSSNLVSRDVVVRLMYLHFCFCARRSALTAHSPHLPHSLASCRCNRSFHLAQCTPAGRWGTTPWAWSRCPAGTCGSSSRRVGP